MSKNVRKKRGKNTAKNAAKKIKKRGKNEINRDKRRVPNNL